MTTVTEIAAEAFAAVKAEITDAIQTGTLIEPSKLGFDQITASRVVDDVSHGTGDVLIETAKPIEDVFPDFTAGSGDQLVLVHGFATRPVPNWILRLSSDHTIRAVQDILGAGSLFYMVIR